MKLTGVTFKEGQRHAWLLTEGSSELFIQRPMEALTVTAGHLTCWVPADQREEIINSYEGVQSNEPDAVFLCCAGQNDTKIYYVEEAVTYSGGDILLFLKPIATIH